MEEHTGPEYPSREESAAESRPYENRQERSEQDIRSRLNRYVKSRVADQIVLSGVKLRKGADALKKTAGCFEEEEFSNLRRYVTRSANRIEDLAMYLQDASIDRIIDDVREFSLKRPWLFMGASFSAGILLARIIKASQAQS